MPVLYPPRPGPPGAPAGGESSRPIARPGGSTHSLWSPSRRRRGIRTSVKTTGRPSSWSARRPAPRRARRPGTRARPPASGSTGRRRREQGSSARASPAAARQTRAAVGSRAWIEDAHEHEPVGGRRRPRERAVPRREHAPEPRRLLTPEPHLDRAPDDVPHHVMQETVGREEDPDEPFAPDDTDRADRAGRLAVPPGGRAERGEVVAAAERGQAGAHRGQVERAADVPRVAQRE